jgi:hypothetical protein
MTEVNVRISTAACILLLAVAATMAAQERRTAPLVPSNMLQGRRLVDKESHFSLEAPSKWVWLAVPSEAPGFRNYAASNPDGLGYAVNVMPGNFSWTAEDARDVQIGMAKKLRSKGFSVELLSFNPCDVPREGSFRFSWRVKTPQGVVMYRFGYVLKHADHLFSFTCFAPDESEPTAFSRFIRSAQFF